MMHATRRTVPIPGITGILLLIALACPAIGSAQSSGPLSSNGYADHFDAGKHRGREPGRLGGPNRPPGGQEDGPAKPVPEPGTMALLAFGLVAVGSRVRKLRGA